MPRSIRVLAMLRGKLAGLTTTSLRTGPRCIHACPRRFYYDRVEQRAFTNALPGILGRARFRVDLPRAVSTDTSLDAPPESSNKALVSDTVVVLDVTKMMCGGCSASVKKILSQQPKVKEASVNLITGTAVVHLVPESSDQDVGDIVRVVSDKGFPTFLRTAENNAEQMEQIRLAKVEEEKKERLSLQFAWILAVSCYGHHLGHLLHGLGLHQYAHSEFMSWLGTPVIGGALGAIAILGPGRELLRDGFKAFVNGRPNMNSLISLGATTSFSTGLLSAFMPDLSIDPSFLEEPVMLLAFVLLGRSLEKKARAEASDDLTTLANLIPSHARLVKDEIGNGANTVDAIGSISIPTSMIRTGDVIQVFPSETIPVDGEIVMGACSVDEALLTGESKTILKTSGDTVTGGTVLFDSPVLVKATTTGESSTLSRIGRLVAEAQGREAPIQRLADQVAGWFCYSVMSASVLTFGFWYSLGTHIFPNVLYSNVMADINGSIELLSLKLAIDVLVVACPCALGLATPTAVLVSSSAAAKRGILVKGGETLERMSGISSIIFDKTGTVTEGKLQVLSVSNFRGTKEDVIRLAATAEIQTIHPIATSLQIYAQENGIQPGKIATSATEPGNGVSAKIDGEDIYVGRQQWVAHKTGDLSIRPSQPEFTEIWVGSSSDGVLGKICLSDSVRKESRDVIQGFQKEGKKVFLLSGDNREITRRVGTMIGIPEGNILSEKSPEQKAEFVDTLKNSGETVAMVGDGVNDTIALGSADIGIAMGKGTDAAGSAADVVLLGDKLTQLQEAIFIGDTTMAKIKQNLTLALMYNSLGIPIAAGALLPKFDIILSPTLAAAMMACSSIVVVGNSVLLKRKFASQ